MNLLFASALSLLFVSVTFAQDICERVTTKSHDGVVICNKEKPKGPGYWTPSKNQILEVEKRLPNYVRWQKDVAGTKIPDHLKEYKRYYEGIIRNRHHQIDIDFMHESSDLVKEGKWLKDRYEVMGGGDNYFVVTFDSDERKFVEIVINAPE